MRRKFILLLALLILFAPLSYADRGAIPFNPDAKIFEPNQRAMIAWNGEEEILLLSTDLHASEPTKILEVIPLPSEPVVKKGDIEVFKKATAFINRKLQEQYTQALHEGVTKGIGRPPAGEVAFHEKIGAHDISVVHVLNTNGFVDWVEKYLRSANVENPKIPEDVKMVVGEYLEEGFMWFVFDVVELDSKPKTSEAIQYRFKSDFLFYPLKITKTAEGYTVIDLLILTPKLLSKFPGIPAGVVELSHKPISLSRQELRSLSEEMDELLGHREGMQLRIWRIQGKLSSFGKDLIAKEGI